MTREDALAEVEKFRQHAIEARRESSNTRESVEDKVKEKLGEDSYEHNCDLLGLDYHEIIQEAIDAHLAGLDVDELLELL